MINQNYFSGTTPEGVTLIQRILSSGFPIENPHLPGRWAVGPIAQSLRGRQGCLRTRCKHRRQCANRPFRPDHRSRCRRPASSPRVAVDGSRFESLAEARRDRRRGCGSAEMTTLDYSIDIAAPAKTRRYLTGVVFKDANGNGSYDIGEGRGGVTVKAVGSRGHGTTTTFASGGYTLPLRTGTYTVTVSGGGLSTR